MTVDLNRRDVMGAAIVAAAARPAFGQDQPRPAESWSAAGPDLTGTPARPVVIPAPAEPIGLLSKEVIELWPQGKVPGVPATPVHRLVLERGSPTAHDRAIMHVSRPIMEVFRPARPNGAAMVVFPGGGYVRLAIDKEGAGSARFLTDAGVTTFVLNYRLPLDGWVAGHDCALQDAQRALRLIRADAARWGVDSARIGVMGFSAGGHLAASSLTRHDLKTYDPLDAADGQSARPDMAVLGYAPVGARASAAGQPGKPVPALNSLVATGMSPTFVFQAADDPTVSVTNSLTMFSALLAAKVPSELHLYQEGGHGFGFSLPPEMPASRWPQDWLAWARRIGFLGR
jgi:acetyl esterase/lipase